MKKLLLMSVLLVLPVLAVAGEKTVEVYWEHDGVGIEEFRLYHSTAQGFAVQDADGMITIPMTAAAGGTEPLSYTSTETITAPDNAETEMFYKMTAFDGSLESGPSNEVSLVLDFLAPAKPFNLKITIVAE